MPKITAIEVQKKHRGRVNVFVDERFSFGIETKLLVDFDLYQGKELTSSDIEKVKSGDNDSRCLQKAYRFLSYRPRTEKEIRDKLAEGYENITVGKTVKKLKEYNLINDEEFARSWISYRLPTRSANKIAYELTKKGVAKSIVEKQLQPVTKEIELESALKLVQSKPKYRGLTKNDAYKKIGGFLSRRGFSYEIIKKVIETVK